MNGFKSHLHSKTLWCVALALLVLLAFRLNDRFGWHVLDDVQGWKDAAVFVLVSAAGAFRAGASKQLGTPSDPNDTSGGGFFSPVLMLALIPTIFLAGCQFTTPQQAAVDNTAAMTVKTNDAITFAVQEVDAAVRTGLLKPEQVRPWLPIRDAARAAVKSAKADIDAGNPDAARLQLDAANAAMGKLAPLLNWIHSGGK